MWIFNKASSQYTAVTSMVAWGQWISINCAREGTGSFSNFADKYMDTSWEHLPHLFWLFLVLYAYHTYTFTIRIHWV